MYLDDIINLPEKVAKLPEVGTVLVRARLLSRHALAIQREYQHLLAERDKLRADIYETWTREERKESGL